MAARTNELIQTVYKNKLVEQEMLVSRKNAELLALHSQINPHFLFNALESIRMHSILKNENETADMVEKLAVMQRQYVEWGEDSVTIEQEVEFVKAYLALQKYRFGERLSYQIEIDEECRKRKVPKLTLVTFVENACVHGIESKASPGWIFVRVYEQNELICMEIEDTGNGMEEGKRQELLENMRNADIEMLKKKGRVGIVNACLRLKMVSENKVKIDLDGEEGVGTLITIWMPLEYM
jgi:two-component system sensor histidine kinase YesM